MHSTIPDEIIALDMPAIGEVVVIGGGAMELLGLRRANDIDMVVSLKNWRYLRDVLEWKVCEKPDTRRFLSDNARRFDTWRWWFNPEDRSRTKLSALRKRCLRHETGFYYLRPEAQVAFKQQLGRGKDDRDVRILERYLH